MPGIITITFNPCIDKSTTVAALIPEKKLRCTAAKFEPGGGGINVARVIKKLGGEATAIYSAGGYTGIFFTQLLKQEGIKTIVVETATHTRENFIVVDTSTNLQYRFGMPGQRQTESEWQKCLDEIKRSTADFFVASGSLPPGIPPDILASINEIVKKKNSKLIVDSSGEALKLAIEKGVYLIKPNLGELAKLVNREEIDLKNITPLARQLIHKGGTEVVIVSMGAAGAQLITKDESIHFLAPPVKKKGTVGAGDSMVAGIVFCLSQNKSLVEATRFGVACGTAAIMNSGTELCKVEDVENLYPLISATTELTFAE